MQPRPLERWRWPLVIALLVALPLRIYRLTFQNIWFDEAYSWRLALKPLREIVTAAQSDVHPPLYYFILKGWMGLFGSSETALRSLSLTASLAMIPVGYEVLREWIDERAAGWFLLLVAVSPHQIFFAQEARMYALVTLFSLLTVQGYARWADRGKDSGLVRYAIFGLLAIYTHYFSFLVLFAIQVDLLARWARSDRRPNGAGKRQSAGTYLATNALLAICYLPWLTTVFRQFQRGQAWRQASGGLDFLVQLRSFFLEMLLGYSVYVHDLGFGLRKFLMEPLDRINLVFLFQQVWMLILGGVVFAFLLVCAARQRRAGRAARLFVVPLALGLILSLRQSLQLSRYLSPTFPFLAFILAAALTSLRSRGKEAATGTLMLSVMLTALIAYYRTPRRDSDYRPVAEWLKTDLRENDAVIVDPDYMLACLEYYARGTGLAARLNQEAGSGAVAERLAGRQACERAWVIADYRSALFSSPAAALGDNWRLQDEQRWPKEDPKIRVMLLAR